MIRFGVFCFCCCLFLNLLIVLGENLSDIVRVDTEALAGDSSVLAVSKC